MSKINNETLQSILGSKTVAFHAVFAKALASVPAAVMLSQAIFWQESARYKRTGITIDGAEYFQATAEDWFEETGLTKEQQSTSRKKLAGILQEKRAGVPAKMHYRIDIDALVAVIYRYLKEGIPVSVDHRSKLRQKPRTSSGKFRQLEAVKNGNSYIIESLESLESVREETPTPAPVSSTLKTDTLRDEHSAGPAAPLFSQLPKARTAQELEAELRELYRAFPDQWKYITTETPAAAMTTAQRTEVVRNFCAWAIGEGWERRDFGKINARLQRWFRDEPRRASRPGTTTNEQPPAYVRPKRLITA